MVDKENEHQARLVAERELDTFSERLEWALNVRKRTQAWLAEQLKISDQAISKWKATESLSRENLLGVCRLLEVEAGWLMNGWGPGPLAREHVATLSARQPPAYYGGEGMVNTRVPVVGTAQLGDNGYWAEFEAPPGHGDGHVRFASKDPNAYALRCRGDSMKPRIKPGEFVIVEPNRAPQPGDAVLVKDRSDRVMVKEWLYTRGGIVHLLSVNETHGKIEIPQIDIVHMHPIGGIAMHSLWENE